jgi:transcriptional regulator
MNAEANYPPKSYRENRRDVLLDFMRATAFGHLISAGGGTPRATGAPFLVREIERTLYLEAHLQRGNPQWRTPGEEGLVLFQGPHAYVHPGWYETKKRDGRAVPTWNYITVQARGPVEIIADDSDWLRGHLAALTDAHEAGRPDPWSREDAPGDYIEALLRGIVGVRLTVRELDGRWKMNQNHPEANRRGVIDGLSASAGDGDRAISEAMARLEAARGGLRPDS